jgi:hypothetical protein
MRQSMPSGSIESCAAVSETTPVVACGQAQSPRPEICPDYGSM